MIYRLELSRRGTKYQKPMHSFIYHIAASATVHLPDDANVEPLEALKAAEKIMGDTSDNKALDTKSDLPLSFSSGSNHTVVMLYDVTPLSFLLLTRDCTRASIEGRFKAAQYLLEPGADPNSEILLD